MVDVRIEIDQSGKIEETHRDTYLAFSNGKQYTIRITAKTKRRLQEAYRQIGRPRDFVVGVFSVTHYKLIEKHISIIDEIIIDREYPGQDLLIIRILKAILTAHAISPVPRIYFTSIGKRSSAHRAAINSFRKKSPPDKTISYEALVDQCFIYKNGYPVLKYLVSKDR